MMIVASISESDDQAGIRNRLDRPEKPFRDEKSDGPDKAPGGARKGVRHPQTWVARMVDESADRPGCPSASMFPFQPRDKLARKRTVIVRLIVSYG
jgi:hypothetical protein